MGDRVLVPLVAVPRKSVATLLRSGEGAAQLRQRRPVEATGWNWKAGMELEGLEASGPSRGSDADPHTCCQRSPFDDESSIACHE